MNRPRARQGMAVLCLQGRPSHVGLAYRWAGNSGGNFRKRNFRKFPEISLPPNPFPGNCPKWQKKNFPLAIFPRARLGGTAAAQCESTWIRRYNARPPATTAQPLPPAPLPTRATRRRRHVPHGTQAGTRDQELDLRKYSKESVPGNWVIVEKTM